MIPTGDEYIVLYALYAVFLIGIVVYYLKVRSNWGIVNLIVFSIYFLFLVSIYSDESSFKGGSSLVVLFYSWLFILGHLVSFLIYGFVVWALDKLGWKFGK